MKISQAALLLVLVGVLSSVSQALPRGSTHKRGNKRSLSSVNRKLMGGGGKKGDGSPPEPEEVDDACEVTYDDPVFLCTLLEVFYNMGEDENNKPASEGYPGYEWDELCDDFEPVDQYICPDDAVVANICLHRNPHLNPAVKQYYCEPLFADFDEEDFERCVFYCVNYVSQARGGCCGDWECDISNE